MTKKITSGFTLLEVMVTVVILALGMMGLGAMILRGQQTTREAYDRVTALYYLNFMTERIRANASTIVSVDSNGVAVRSVPAYATEKSNLPGTGTVKNPSTSDGTISPEKDLYDWDQLLTGINKTIGGNKAGGVEKIFGCITLNDSFTDKELITENTQPDYLLLQPPTWLDHPDVLPQSAGDLISWTVEVVWQGGPTQTPNTNPTTCATEAFGDVNAPLVKSVISTVTIYR